MGIKVLAIGAAAAVLLAPGAAVLGIATLFSPAAAGSGSCMWDDHPTGSLGVSGPVPASLSATNTNGETVTLDQQQLTRAATIIAVGKTEQLPARGQLIAIMTALTESSLRVLSNTGAYPQSGNIPNDGNGGDHDSLGLFQQRPAAGWGTVENLMDPVWSSRAFYGGPSGPNHGSPRGPARPRRLAAMDPGAAAQAVQVSAYPDRYAVNQPIAEKVLTTLSGVSLSSDLDCAQPSGDLPANLPPGFPGALIAAAASQIGKPYVWGGGNFYGPTGGGFDCSGLVLYAAYQASGGRIRLPHYTGDQIHARHRHPLGRQAARRPDLLQLPRRRRPAPRRDLRRRRQDPPGAADRRPRPLRHDRRVLRRGHDHPPARLKQPLVTSPLGLLAPSHFPSQLFGSLDVVDKASDKLSRLSSGTSTAANSRSARWASLSNDDSFFRCIGPGLDRPLIGGQLPCPEVLGRIAVEIRSVLRRLLNKLQNGPSLDPRRLLPDPIKVAVQCSETSFQVLRERFRDLRMVESAALQQVVGNCAPERLGVRTYAVPTRGSPRQFAPKDLPDGFWDLRNLSQELALGLEC